MNSGSRSIREKLQAIVVVTTLVALACALAGNMAGNVWSLYRLHVADIDTQAELLGRMTSPALMFDDAALAKDNLDLFQARPNIRAAAIYNGRGELFATYNAPGREAAFPDKPGPGGTRVEGTELVAFKPIVKDDEVIGTVYLRAGYNVVETLLGNFVLAVPIGLFAMAIAFFMIRRLEKVVTRPIAAVAAAAREVMLGREYSRRVAKDSDDEVGELVESFNDMLGEIERRTRDLQKSYGDVIREADERALAQREVMRLNASLEQRVLDRTSALEESNRALSLAKASADEANSAKSSFLATMSHEIRTPMNGVIGMIDVLHQTSLNGHQVEMVDLIRESAFSLLTIIDDILDFSKIEAGRLELERAPVALSEVVENVCGMFDHLAIKKGVEFTQFVDPAIPGTVIGDAVRLRQVLVNLVSNAIKFSGDREQPGRVAVRLELASLDAGQALVDIHVSDNGIGIDEETRARLFTAFGQADTSTTRRFGGTGLGLAISRHLVDLMGGRFSLQSEPGEGSTFSVRLPLVLPAEPAEVAVKEAELSGLRCLVVGGPGGLAADVAAYAAGDGAQAERAPDLAQARAMMDGLAGKAWIWIVDMGGITASHQELRDLARSLPERDIRFVVIGRGPRREPYAIAADIVSVDGNVLSRRRLSKAIALAAGRVTGQALAPPAGRQRLAFDAPPREEARRNRRLVLVAEDNETNQKVILRQLALLGFAADVAANGRLALERWEGGDYALLLTDLHMPAMDGYELTAAIRAHERGPYRIPILALTANALEGEAERCRAAGMDDYMSKPLQLADLKAALERWLPLHGAGPDAQAGASHDGRARAVVDVKVLEGLVGDDPAVVLDFLQDFQRSAGVIAQALRAACAAADMSRISAQAHKLKSSACTVGALALGELCAQIEAAGKAGSEDALLVLVPAFEREFDAVNRFLDSMQARPSAGGGALG
jgi:signal transduction histidine kinase/CheY-like chemotaxis protein/HPt (histidine-containing phosphotransfer) domain-containing protein